MGLSQFLQLGPIILKLCSTVPFVLQHHPKQKEINQADPVWKTNLDVYTMVTAKYHMKLMMMTLWKWKHSLYSKIFLLVEPEQLPCDISNNRSAASVNILAIRIAAVTQQLATCRKKLFAVSKHAKNLQYSYSSLKERRWNQNMNSIARSCTWSNRFVQLFRD